MLSAGGHGLAGLLSTAVAPPAGELRTALWWRERASSAPERAVSWAQQRTGAADPQLRALARHVLALAAVERGALGQAREHARAGAAVAGAAGLTALRAQLQLTLAWIELDSGNTAASWEVLESAQQRLPAAERGRARCLRGLLRCQRGEHGAAVAELTAALQQLAENSDPRWVANALLGRGLAHLYRGELEAAEADFAVAERMFAAEGCAARAAGCRHNRGYVAFRSGDLPRALRLFDEALAAGLDADANPEVLVDRAQALAAAGLDEEARSAMERAVDQLAAKGRAGQLAEAELALASFRLRAGDPTAAGAAAVRAKRLFRGQRRTAWAALAAAVGWQARLLAGQRSRRAFAAAHRAARACARFGWTGPAAELWLVAGRSARRAGAHRWSRKMLRLAAASRSDPAAAPQQRALGWLAAALLAEQQGDVRRLFAACRGGLQVLERQAAGMAAFELRVQAYGLAEEIGAVAVGAALRTGDARTVLRWVERCRASALHRRALQPPTDPALQAVLVQLRSAVVHMRSCAHPGAAVRRVAELENEVRHRSLLVAGRTAGLRGSAGISDVIAELGGAVGLSLFTCSGKLFAVSIVDGSVRLHPLGSKQVAETQAGRLRHLLGRQAETAAPQAEEAFARAARQAAEQLQRQLLAPVLRELEQGRPLVVVPAGRLHALPWAALPACRGLPVTVSPSLCCWLRAAGEHRRRPRKAEPVWIAGPGLDHAEQEVRALHRMFGGRLLAGETATSERVLEEMERAAVAHLAAHGKFRDDQPQLSGVELADGPLYAYDLERLPQAPATVVLSACEVGRSAVRSGEQLSGLTTTLLNRGTATVVASVVPVPDERTADLMLSLHRSLQAGASPAAALASAQAEHGEAGFVCLGYGGDR